MLWKTDLDAAYKQWPFEEAHRHRMGFRWLDVDKPIPDDILSGKREPRDDELVYYWINRLPFGWTKSVSHFHRVSRALKALHLWEGTPVGTAVPRHVHDTSVYVDDCGGVALEEWAEQSKRRYHEVCSALRVPISMKKELLEGAIEATKQFLGIVVDTLRGEKRLSEARVERGLERLKELDGKAFVATRELRSLVGVLSFAAQCCRHARTFLRRCWDALKGSRRRRWTRLDRGIQADLQWWKRFWKDYNGVHLTAELGWQLAEDIGLFTDASLDGWGAVYDGEWMGGRWPACAEGLAINELELLVVTIAAKQWGPKWARRLIVTTCDNMASVFTINKGSAKNPAMMVAMRELFLVAAKGSFEMKAKYINTKLNVMADAISRGDIDRFLEHAYNVLGVDKMVEVEPQLDVEAVLRRMQKARRANERRNAAAAKRV